METGQEMSLVLALPAPDVLMCQDYFGERSLSKHFDAFHNL